MAKINIGDKVRVRKGLIDGERYGENVFVSKMKEKEGKVGTIIDKKHFGYRVGFPRELLKSSKTPYLWTAEMLEPVYTFQDFMEDKIKLGVQTQEEYELVLRLIENQRPDLRWRSKVALQDFPSGWNIYKSETTLNINEGNYLTFADKRHYTEEGFLIVNFADLENEKEEMKEYTIQDFISGEIVVNCETKTECYQLAAALEKEDSNISWRSGHKIANEIGKYWNRYKTNIIFTVSHRKELTFGDISDDFTQKIVKFSDLKLKKYRVSVSGDTREEVYNKVSAQLAEQDKSILYWTDEENERAKEECLALMVEHIEKTAGQEQIVFSGYFPKRDNSKTTTGASIILCGSMWPAMVGEGFLSGSRRETATPKDGENFHPWVGRLVAVCKLLERPFPKWIQEKKEK